MSGISSGVGETSVRIKSKSLPYRAILMISDHSMVAAGADNVAYHLVKNSSGKWVTNKELSSKSGGAAAGSSAAASPFSSAKRMVRTRRKEAEQKQSERASERARIHMHTYIYIYL